MTRVDVDLKDAVKNLNVKAVRRALRAGADPNITRIEENNYDIGPLTPLNYICTLREGTVEEEERLLDILRILLKAGADVSVPGGCSWSPLVGAAFRGREDFVALLIEHGAGVNSLGGGNHKGQHFILLVKETTLRLCGSFWLQGRTRGSRTIMATPV